MVSLVIFAVGGAFGFIAGVAALAVVLHIRTLGAVWGAAIEGSGYGADDDSDAASVPPELEQFRDYQPRDTKWDLR